MNRRNVIKTVSATAGLSLISGVQPIAAEPKKTADKFRLSLNTSTIMGQKLGVEKYIDIAARAGYDCIELWTGDVKEYVAKGGSLPVLKTT
jgi:hypothetical protein